jgi:uncharacterized membrane protein
VSHERTEHPTAGAAFLAIAGSVLSLIGTTLFLQTVLESPALSGQVVTPGLRGDVLQLLGAKLFHTAAGLTAVVSFFPVLAFVAALGVGFLCGRLLLKADGDGLFSSRLFAASRKLAVAGRAPTAWWATWMVCVLLGWAGGVNLLEQVVDLVATAWIAFGLLAVWPSRAGVDLPASVEAGVITRSRGARTALVAGMLAYVAVYVTLNFGLWFNLRIPHGDSAMYEEHLWNLEHGKGFRSYLDQGLFLGEHLQVIHVLLVPAHLVFPSHLTLEFCQSVILALGAWPLFRIARRHSGSEWAAALLALAYLAYFPLQYLDIAIDLKTFRPNSLGIPTFLAALDLLERRRYGWASFWLAITLSAQEDWAIPIALIGAWLALAPRPFWPKEAGRRVQIAWGLGLFLFGVVYLWLALNVVIPWFRGGATVHTASYFSKFGATPREIIVTLLSKPTLVISTLVTPAAVVYALRLLVPIAFLPLRSPSRALVAAPLFLLICMNDLAMQWPAPVHHFHASLVPVLFWAAAAGLGEKRVR